MKESLLNQLMKIPREATSASIRGIQMQMIDEQKRQVLLQSDPEDKHIHEYFLANGTFLADIQDGNLLSLYKVEYSPKMQSGK